MQARKSLTSSRFSGSYSSSELPTVSSWQNLPSMPVLKWEMTWLLSSCKYTSLMVSTAAAVA